VYVVYSIAKATGECSQLLFDEVTRRHEWVANGTRFPDLRSVHDVVAPIVQNWMSHSRSVPCIKWLPNHLSNAEIAAAAPTSYAA
jgi:hypothetical protein